MLEIIGNLLSLKLDYDFWKKKKAHRKFERENNLPKKLMINPIWKLLIDLILAIRKGIKISEKDNPNTFKFHLIGPSPKMTEL